MAVGAVQAGYNPYYPAKVKAKENETNFSAFAPDVANRPDTSDVPNVSSVPDAVKKAVMEAFAQKETQENVDYQQFLHKKIEELYAKFQSGESEPSYQIGSASFTEKEWDKLLEKFDALQETIRTQMREEHAKRAEAQERQAVYLAERTAAKEQQEETVQAGTQADSAETSGQQEASLLSGEYTMAAYPPDDPEDEPVQYITCYTEDGIFCRKAGSEGYKWSIRFADKEEYSKVMQFLAQFPSDWNMRFASSETFWKDFLDDKIDMDRFMEFLDTTDKGVPDYTITVGDSMFIDKEKAQWAKYMNQSIGKFYTAEQMQQMLDEQIAENLAKLPRITDLYKERKGYKEYRM